MNTVNDILNARKRIAKIITSPFCGKYRNIFVKFLNDTDEVEQFYLAGVVTIFEKYCEREENNKIKLKDNFYDVLPENQSKVMDDVNKLKETEINSQNIADSFVNLESALDEINNNKDLQADTSVEE